MKRTEFKVLNMRMLAMLLALVMILATPAAVFATGEETPNNSEMESLFDENEEPPAKRGVLGASVGIIGSIQATEVIKYFTGIGELLTNSLLTLDVRTMKFMRLKMKVSAKCSCNDI